MQRIYHLSIFFINNISYLNLFGWANMSRTPILKEAFLFFYFFILGVCVGVGIDKSHKKMLI